MSIHNYKQGTNKAWAIADLEDLAVKSVDVDQLNISDFVTGAIESINNYVPTLINQTGSLTAAAISVKGGYVFKINNLVRCRLVLSVTTTGAGGGSFSIDRSTLPISKASQFSDLDRGTGVSVALGGGDVIIGGSSAVSPFPSDELVCTFDALTAATLYQLNVEFEYTTN